MTMIHQRKQQHAPSSTGLLERNATATDDRNTSQIRQAPRSANSVEGSFHESRQSSSVSVSASSDVSHESHNVILYPSSAPSSLRGADGPVVRPRRRLPPEAASTVGLPFQDSDVRYRSGRAGIGGMEDPSYRMASASATTNANATTTNGVNTTNSLSKQQFKSNNDNETFIPATARGSNRVSIPIAILLWYLLGVISIATSKLLLSSYNIPPSIVTMQQLLIGMTILRTLLEMQTTGEKEKDLVLRRGLQPLPMQQQHGDGSSNISVVSALLALVKRPSLSSSSSSSNHVHAHVHNQLFLAAIYFALGFLLTNYGFQSGSAAFVETVKAAEPFTSATVAVLWGLERLGMEEVCSLTGIVSGVVLSTFGHRSSGTAAPPTTISTATTSNANGRGEDDALELPHDSLLSKCLVVMLANLCFSFRGLHQKLFRASPQGNASAVDDLNLQYRMQQIGILTLLLPTVLGNVGWVWDKWQQQTSIVGGLTIKYAFRYILLSFVNGFAFASYNLASTYVLTRISVVHHAALNCIRRVFAIIVTSIIFGLQITMLQIVGITMAVCGFFSYLHYKLRKETKEKRRKDLRRKWGGILRNSGKNGRWIGKSSSLLPVSNVED